MLCLAVGAGAAVLSLEGCTNLPIIRLKNNNGSIELDENAFGTQGTTLIVRADNLPYDLFLIKQGQSKYRAMLMQCTHQDVGLSANNNGLYCPSHGSRFNLNGEVLEGPALKPLKNFPVKVQNNKIVIKTA